MRARLCKYRRLILITSICILIFITLGFMAGQRLNVHTEQIDLGLPTHIKLAVLADFHIDTGENIAISRQALAEAMRQQPDAILLVGDYANSETGIKLLPDLFKGIKAPLGVYAVRGNHDHKAGIDRTQQALESVGVKLLVAQNVLLQKGQTKLALAGIDDFWHFTGRAEWEQTYKDFPKDTPLILLSHNPDAVLSSQGQRAKLVISGHTHAGHANLPYAIRKAVGYTIGQQFPSMTEYGMLHPCGLMHERWGWVYITSGVEAGYLPPRWYTRPEVAVLELR